MIESNQARIKYSSLVCTAELLVSCPVIVPNFKQESCAVAREPHDAAAVVFGLKFADNIHYHFTLEHTTD